MKRFIAIVAVLAVAVTAVFSLPVTAAKAAETPHQLNMIEDFSEAKVGESFSDAKLFCVESQGYNVCSETLGALGAKNSVMLNYTEFRGYHNIAGDQGFKLCYQKPVSLKDAESIMYYIKLSPSRVCNDGENWMSSGIALMMYLGDGVYTTLTTDQKVQILQKNTTEWKEFDVLSGIYLNLPSGFEGYIKIDVDNYQKDLPKNIREYSIHQTIMQFANMGDYCGPAYINGVYTVTNETNSIYAKFNGDDVLYNMSSNKDTATASPKAVQDLAMKAKLVQSFDAYTSGYDLLKHGVASLSNKKDITMRTVDWRGGFDKTPSLEISSPTTGSFYDVDPMYTFKYPNKTAMDDMKAILFYIECPEKSIPQQPNYSGVRFNIRSQKNGDNKWSLLGNGQARYLENGATEWKTAAEDSIGLIRLPVGFSGWIMVNIEEFLQNPIADDLEGRTAFSSTFQFQGLGGDCGPAYIDSVMFITDMKDKEDTFVTFDGHNVWDLTTGKRAVMRAKPVTGMVVGGEYTSIPDATLNEGIKDIAKDELSSSQVILRWDAKPDAASYRVDLYKTENSAVGGSIAYVCKKSRFIDDTSIYFDGLEASTRYYAIVTALDSKGEEIGVYKYARFYTTADTSISAPSDIQTGTDASEKEPMGIMTWVLVGGIILVAAVAILIIGLTGKKSKKEEA